MNSTVLFSHFLILSVYFSSFECRSQSLTIGPAFGFHIRNNTGVSVVSDSIVVYAEGSRTMMNVFSAFSEYKIKDRFNVRGTLSVTNHLLGYGLYNKGTTCSLCPVTKGTTVGAWGIGLGLVPEIRVTKLSSLNIYAVGGIRSNINLLIDNGFQVGERGRDPGLWETINHLDEVMKPVYFNSVVGLKLDWKRFALFFELDKNLGQTITRPVRVYDKEYYLNTKTNTFMLQLGYKLFPLKK